MKENMTDFDQKERAIQYMRMKIISILLITALFWMLFPGAASADDIYVYDGDTLDLSTCNSGDLIHIDAGAAVILKGSKRVSVLCGSDVELTLDNVTIDWRSTEIGIPINFLGGENTLTLVGTSTLKGWEGSYSSIYVNKKGTDGIYCGGDLTIGGEGTLNTYGGRDCYGIECRDTLVINSGTIYATYLNSLATLGSSGIICKDLIVNDGEVDARGSSANNSIYGYSSVTVKGGTVEANNGLICRNVTITGGNVTSRSRYYAGLGGGSGEPGTVIISGGTVSAQADQQHAAITGATVTISGGTVTATGYYGAGIGGGEDEAGGTITISGGTVTATGRYGAGIGGGRYGGGGDVTVSGGTVTAESEYGAGIGGGQNADGADILISDTAKVYANSNRNEDIQGTESSPVNIRDDALLFLYHQDEITYLVGSVTHAYDDTLHIDTAAGTINGFSVPSAWTDGSFTIRAGYVPAYQVIYDGNGSDGGTVPTEGNSYQTGETVTVSSDEPTRTGYTFAGWSDGSTTYQGGDTFTMSAAAVTLSANWTINAYTVALEENGGGDVADIARDFDSTIDAGDIEEPARSGHTFAGWYTDEDCTLAVSFPYTISCDTTWYAKWTKKKAVPGDDSSPSPTPSATPSPSADIEADRGYGPAPTPTPKLTPTPTSVPAPTSTVPPLPTPMPGGSSDGDDASSGAERIRPNSVAEDEETGAYIIEINVNDLPAGTTSIRTQTGQVISIDAGAASIQVTVEKKDIDKDSTIALIALDDAGTPLGEYDVHVKAESMTIQGSQNAWSAVVSMLVWIVSGIVLCVLLVVIYIIVKKRKDGTEK